jgi:hypothetical protein
MIKGNVGDCDLMITLVDNLKDEEHDDLEGRARKRQKVQLVEVEIDSGLDGRALLNTLLHELFHIVECVYGWEVEHDEVWTLSAALSQALITTGIVVPTELEARLRMLNEKEEVVKESV